ncbi:MAG: hypothetical protein QOJ59_2883 [Thermomicrobiales bacterium]|nr:hypothetical protein [Thermomicrobiales bacterium]
MSHKPELLAAITENQEELEAVVAAYGVQLDAELDGDWTVRDAVAHVAVWERVAVRKINGTPLPVGEELAARRPWDLDAFNEGMRDLLRSWSDEQILAEFGAAHHALRLVVEGASEEDCVPKGKVWQVIEEDSAGHYHFHFPVRDVMSERWPSDAA